ncbi:MAG: alcohol dehydrogenase catalytic domain-containing protein [Chloroflexota bacterium]|nr:alcohol dehydrogenase catalytic domain-containing protein [Chloroflexota bacterium]
MQALLFDGQLRLANEHPEPILAPGEALIRPTLVGICNTDIEITRGYMGFRGVLGHEFVGVVQDCEDRAWVGRRVVGEINAACRRCAVCARGDESHCPERTTLGIDRRDGAMAELFSLPIACLHEVPASVPDQAAVFAEPLAAALEILEQSHVRPTDRVAVVGDGKLGLLCAQVLRLPGCEVVVIGRHPERWELLHQQGIATADERRRTKDEHNEAFIGPSSFDIVVDCTGQPAGLAVARNLARPRGRLVLKSTFAAESGLNLSKLVVDEVQLLGSRCGPFAPALRLLERGLINVQPLVAGQFPLHNGLSAFAAASHHLKILLEI